MVKLVSSHIYIASCFVARNKSSYSTKMAHNYKSQEVGGGGVRVHNILLVWVCATHMGGFWPLNYLKKDVIFINFFI